MQKKLRNGRASTKTSVEDERSRAARKPSLGAGRYKRIVARTITPATPQITTIANRKCMATPPLPKDHRDGDRRDYTPHETHRYYRVHSETYPRLNHLGDR